jgi:hypothetical protein
MTDRVRWSWSIRWRDAVEKSSGEADGFRARSDRAFRRALSAPAKIN